MNQQHDPSSLRRSMRLQGQNPTHEESSQTRPIVPHPSMYDMSMSSDRSQNSHLTPSNSTNFHTVHSRIQPPSLVPHPPMQLQPTFHHQGRMEPSGFSIPTPVMNRTPSVHTVLSPQTHMPPASSSNVTQTTLFPMSQSSHILRHPPHGTHLVPPTPSPNFEVVSNHSSNSSTIPSQVSIGPAPTISQEGDQVRLLSQQLQELQATNTSFQQCIMQLQTQVTQLIHQNNQLVQKMIDSSFHPSQSNPQTNQTNIVDLLDNGAYNEDIPVNSQATDQSPLQPITNIAIGDPTPRVSNTNSSLLQELMQLSKIKERTPKSPTFPKFSGKDFTLWYDDIISILANPIWASLYDSETDDAIQNEPFNDISADLYTCLKNCLQGNAQKTMLHKKGLRRQGIRFLQVLRATYAPILSSSEVNEQYKLFLSVTRNKGEDVKEFGARCLLLHSELERNGKVVDEDELKTTFIMGLGPEFTAIKTAMNDDNLPPKWLTTNIETLIQVATSYLAAQKRLQLQNQQYRENQKKLQATKTEDNTKSKQTNNQPKAKEANKQDQYTPTKADLARQHSIVTDFQNGTFNPAKYLSQVRPGACIYHGTVHKDATPCRSLVQLAQQYNTTLPSIPVSAQTAPRHHVNQHHQASKLPPLSQSQSTSAPVAKKVTQHTEMENIDLNPFISPQEVADAAEQLLDFEYKLNSNDTVNPYLTCKSVQIKHNLQCHKNRFVIDSGAYPHMWNTRDVFIQYKPWTADKSISNVSLADGKTTAKIEGHGSIALIIDNKLQILHDVLYIPTLSTSLLSVKQHSEIQGNFFHAEKGQAILAFKNLVKSFPMDQSELFVQYSPLSPTTVADIKSKLNNIISSNSISLHTKQVTLLPPISKSSPENIPVKITLNSPSAKTPHLATIGSAGYDIFANQNISIPAKERGVIDTGLTMEIPHGYYGKIAPRSSLAIKKIDIAGGIIDSDYRGVIKVILVNNSNFTHDIAIGDKIAQIIFSKIGVAQITTGTLSQTTRGKGGFGSTDNIDHHMKTNNNDNNENNDNSKKSNKILNPRKIMIKLPGQDNFTKTNIVAEGQQYRIKHKNTPIPFTSEEILRMCKSGDLLFGHHHKIKIASTSSTKDSPKIKLYDKPLVTATDKITMNMEQLQKSFGFRNISSILNEIKATSQNLNLSTTLEENIIDLGQVAKFDRPKRNTTPLELPTSLGDIVHADILFGAGTSIGGYRYALFLVDRATRYKSIYPIKSLKNDIMPAIKQFCQDIGTVPTILRTDFDHKIMGKEVQNFIKENDGTVESVPPPSPVSQWTL